MFATKAEFEETLFQLASLMFIAGFFYLYVLMCMPKTQKQRDQDNQDWERTRYIREGRKITNPYTMVGDHLRYR